VEPIVVIGAGLAGCEAAWQIAKRGGSVALFEPLTGRFVKVFKEEADRLYVADVLGDWREEVIVLSGNELHVYANTEPNLNTFASS